MNIEKDFEPTQILHFISRLIQFMEIVAVLNYIFYSISNKKPKTEVHKTFICMHVFDLTCYAKTKSQVKSSHLKKTQVKSNPDLPSLLRLAENFCFLKFFLLFFCPFCFSHFFLLF
jgi:hypothetical protein